MAGVYISFPFCSQKCTYCNFASGVFPRELARRYVKAVRAEIQSHSWRWQPETVYLGGGTPGDLDPADLAGLLAAVPGGPWTETTIEAAPGSIRSEKAREWRKLGVNRVSLGVQSFVRREMARTGRKHTAEIVERELAVLREAGIGTFNIDLIAGLPGQTEQSWRESLEWIERLGPPHVSVYMLEVDEDSRLGREILRHGSRYGADEVPPEDTIAGMYEAAVEFLRSIGLHRYEISNFARPGWESRHNLKYWRLEPYAGFGADAHSFDGRTRAQNVETAAEYVSRIERGESPRLEETPANVADERFYVGLRLASGIHPSAEDRTRFSRPIRRFLDEGLLEADGEMLRLSERGVLLSNEVFQEFISA
jgi:oxygen-independent coproporphyrinogen-3 oxidase